MLIVLFFRYLYTGPWGPFFCSDSKHVAPGHLGQVSPGEEKMLCCSCSALFCFLLLEFRGHVIGSGIHKRRVICDSAGLAVIY